MNGLVYSVGSPYLRSCVAQDLSDRRLVSNSKSYSRRVLYRGRSCETIGTVRSMHGPRTPPPMFCSW